MGESVTIDRPSAWRSKLVNHLSQERNVTLASAAVFINGLGEELWKKFIPKYLEALGANTLVIGFYGTAYYVLAHDVPGKTHQELFTRKDGDLQHHLHSSVFSA